MFENYDKIPAGTYYWFLGKEFRGDMVGFDFAFDRDNGLGRRAVGYELKKKKRNLEFVASKLHKSSTIRAKIVSQRQHLIRQ